eukprot:1569807-Pyramimonas_sp.AAC.1
MLSASPERLPRRAPGGARGVSPVNSIQIYPTSWLDKAALGSPLGPLEPSFLKTPRSPLEGCRRGTRSAMFSPTSYPTCWLDKADMEVSRDPLEALLGYPQPRDNPERVFK